MSGSRWVDFLAWSGTDSRGPRASWKSFLCGWKQGVEGIDIRDKVDGRILKIVFFWESCCCEVPWSLLFGWQLSFGLGQVYDSISPLQVANRFTVQRTVE